MKMCYASRLAAVMAILLAGCGTADSGTDAGDPQDAAAPGAITISAKLVAGVQTADTSRLVSVAAAVESGEPLGGYKLYCVTFADPPTAGTGTADATGQVTLDLEAVGVPFGCFVLDPEGEAVATLLFRSGAERGQTVTLTGDADLGSVTVDLDNGVAQADAGSGTLTGSEGLACPLGAWVVSVPREDCDGLATATAWFAKNEAGEYRVSFTIGPIRLADTGVCGYHSLADLPATVTDGSWTFKFLNDATCDLVFMTNTSTPNEDCTAMQMVTSTGPCVACTEGACGCGGGTETCTRTFTAVRE